MIVRPSFVVRGRREDRVPAGTHGPLCGTNCTKCTGGITTGDAGTTRPSLHNGLTAYAALSSETNSSCLRHFANWQRKLNPVGQLSLPQSLAPATGARTTRFCRTQHRRSSGAGSNRSQHARQSLWPPCNLSPTRDAVASTASRTPRIVTTRTPLCMRRDGTKRTPISQKQKRIISRARSGRPKSV